MSDNVDITPGSGATMLADELVDGVLGTGKAGFAKIYDGTLGSSNKWIINTSGQGLVYVGNTVTIDGSGVTQPISHAALTELAAAINSSKLDVNIASGSSSGIQYTEGDTDATITGTAILWEDAANTLVPVNTTKKLPVDVSAADRTTDNVGAALVTDALMNDVTPLTPKFAKITASSSGATTIVALVAAKKIRVISWDLVVNAAVNVKWQSHVTPTDKTGLYYFGDNGGISRDFSPLGHFETVAGEALDINLSGAVAVGGSLVYVEV